MKIVTLFSGGGGVEAGMRDAFGDFEGYAVEFDPTNPKLSEQIANCHELNFPDCKLFRESVQQMANRNFEEIPRNPDILWSSTVCCNYSQAKGGKVVETIADHEMALDTIAAVQALEPRHFILEQVRGYEKSNSFKYLILKNLDALGYKYQYKIMRLLGYQTRVRLILWASKTELLPEPKETQLTGWGEKISDLLPTLTKSTLLSAQQKVLEENCFSVPVWINRIGHRNEYKLQPSDMPIGTIIKSLFIDLSKPTITSRNHFADIAMPDGTVLQPNMRCVARLCGFPDWYQLPDKTAIAGSILGNAVPPEFVSNWLGSEEAKKILQGTDVQKAGDEIPSVLTENLPIGDKTTGYLYKRHRNGKLIYEFAVPTADWRRKKTFYVATGRFKRIWNAINAGVPAQITVQKVFG
jgi:DNA (cytosine-5)-methyltransferase 1